jgi:hypothetical protein
VQSTSHLARFVALYFAVTFMVACANQMEPAKNALDNINGNLSAVSADAQKYVPDQFADAQSKVAALNASFQKKDYQVVLSGAPAVLAEVNGLAPAAAAKKDEMLKALGDEWRTLAASVPQSITAVQARLDTSSKARHAPKGVDINSAKSGLADATAAWDKAESTFKSGNAAEAVDTAKDAKSKVEAAAAALKLDLPQSQ